MLSDKPVSKAFFTPDSLTLYFESEYAMFTAAAPDWKPWPFADGNVLVGWVGY
jgi:hypothetical protein